MRFMILVKASTESEAGMMPNEQLLTEMAKFNQELAKAGVLLAGEGLHPSSKGIRIRFAADKRIVTEGPFAGTKDLIAGFWIWQVNSKDEAISGSSARHSITPKSRFVRCSRPRILAPS